MPRSTPSQQLDNDVCPAHRRSNIPPGLRVVSADRLVSTKIRYLGRLFLSATASRHRGPREMQPLHPTFGTQHLSMPPLPVRWARQQMGEHFGRPPQIWKIAQPASQPALSEVCLTSVPCPIQPATRSESIRQSSPSPTTARCPTVTTLSRMAKAGRESSRRNLGGREGGRGLRAMRSADLQLQSPKTTRVRIRAAALDDFPFPKGKRAFWANLARMECLELPQNFGSERAEFRCSATVRLRAASWPWATDRIGSDQDFGPFGQTRRIASHQQSPLHLAWHRCSARSRVHRRSASSIRTVQAQDRLQPPQQPIAAQRHPCSKKQHPSLRRSRSCNQRSLSASSLHCHIPLWPICSP